MVSYSYVITVHTYDKYRRVNTYNASMEWWQSGQLVKAIISLSQALCLHDEHTHTWWSTKGVPEAIQTGNFAPQLLQNVSQSCSSDPQVKQSTFSVWLSFTGGYLTNKIWNIGNYAKSCTLKPPKKGHFGYNINSADLFFVERFSYLGDSKRM
jgi:hypothetical protein